MKRKWNGKYIEQDDEEEEEEKKNMKFNKNRKRKILFAAQCWLRLHNEWKINWIN